MKDRKGITRRKLLKLLTATLGGAAVLKLFNNSNLNQEAFIEIPDVRAEGETVVVGGEYATATSRTRIEGSVGMAYQGVIEGDNTGSHGHGIYGESIKGSGVHGISTDSFGMQGFSVNSVGVYGWVNSGSNGIYGDNLGSGRGIYGMSMYGDGVCGFNRHDGAGVQGFSEATPDSGPAGTGVRGVGSKDGMRGKSNASSGNGVGVQGFGNVSETDGDAGTGVRGVGSSIGIKGESSGLGVLGWSDNGDGVRGGSTNGIGVKAVSTSGTALHVEGKNYFQSAQRATIPTGVRSHVIDIPSGITINTNAMIFVTIMNNSSNIGVRWVERLSDTQFRVHLTGLSRNDMNIGYFIVN